MPTLPTKLIRALAPFAPLSSGRVWQHAQVLPAGAILAPGQRTVGSAPRAMGLDQEEKRFHRYRRVLSRAGWSSREASRASFCGRSPKRTFVPEGPLLVLGIDETLERHRGKKIAAKGIYRDPVRSSHAHFVKASGLRWICATLLAEVPWAGRVWALPFLSALAYSERYAQGLGKPHKKPADWARQLLSLARRAGTHGESRGRGGRHLFFSEASRPLPPVVQPHYLHHHTPAAGRRPLRTGPATLLPRADRKTPPRRRALGKPFGHCASPLHRPEDRHARRLVRQRGGAHGRSGLLINRGLAQHGTARRTFALGVYPRDPQEEFDAQALVCTDLSADPERIVSWFVGRWQTEAAFQEARKHLGFETQRQWSERAIRRSAPALLGLFSPVALFFAHRQRARACSEVRRTAWYDERLPTFADALAAVRKEPWSNATFCGSLRESETVKAPRAFVEGLTDAVCYAA